MDASASAGGRATASDAGADSNASGGAGTDASSADGAGAEPDAGAPAPECGKGILTSKLSYSAAPWIDPGDVWFGGDDRSGDAGVIVHQPRNVGIGVGFSLPYDSLVETFGIDLTGGFQRASSSAPEQATIRLQVRDASGKILFEPPKFVVAETVSKGFLDIPVHAFVPAGQTRIFTLFVEDGMTSGAYTPLVDKTPYESPADGYTFYDAELGPYRVPSYTDEAALTTVWSGLWRVTGGNPADFVFRYAGCQEVCSTTNCDDGDACTDDACVKETGACAHTPKSCDDSISCTVDSCDHTTGCAHAPTPSLCPAQPHCDSARACSPVTGCGIDCSDGTLCTNDSCNETTNQCVHDPADVPISVYDDLDYATFTLRCGQENTFGNDTCSLSASGALTLTDVNDSDYPPAASFAEGCSKGNNRACCFVK